MADQYNCRRQYEQQQRGWLAPGAVGEADAFERKYPERQHAYRTCFQRDRDRIIHCSAFRRLDFKTQVFVPHEHDHFRTRLTHTLEVAQIARTLSRAMRLNEDLSEAIALAHDLGHPPFGHSGEQALDELMADHGRFEHNRQSLRVVDYLEHPYPNFRGLNLTNVVRECLAKHETKYDSPICEDFDESLRAPLEGQLVDLADEIAYTSADLSDALSAGWINERQLEELQLWRLAWSKAEEQANGASAIHKRIITCRLVLAGMADDVVAATSERIRLWGIESTASARKAKGRCVIFSDRTAGDVSLMQDFLMREVYLHPRNIEHSRYARRIISELFEAYTTDPHLLPQRYRRRIDSDSLHRVTCDYIAGMTDRFCRSEHEKL